MCVQGHLLMMRQATVLVSLNIIIMSQKYVQSFDSFACLRIDTSGGHINLGVLFNKLSSISCSPKEYNISYTIRYSIINPI